jgi:hypothetical protein
MSMDTNDDSRARLLAEYEAAVKQEQDAWKALDGLLSTDSRYSSTLAAWRAAAQRAERLAKRIQGAL